MFWHIRLNTTSESNTERDSPWEYLEPVSTIYSQNGCSKEQEFKSMVKYFLTLRLCELEKGYSLCVLLPDVNRRAQVVALPHKLVWKVLLLCETYGGNQGGSRETHKLWFFWLTRPQGGLGLWNDCFLYPAAFLHWPSPTGEKWERNSKCRVDYRSRQPWRIKVSYFRRYEIIEPYPFPLRLFKIVLVPMGASMLCWQIYNQFLILRMIWVIQIRGQDVYAPMSQRSYFPGNLYTCERFFYYVPDIKDC